MVDTAGTEPALSDLETPALPEHYVARGYADCFEQGLRVAVRRVVESKYREHLLDLEAGSVEWHDDLGLLLMPRRADVGLSHDNSNLAMWVARTRRPPFPAIYDVLIPVAPDARLDIGGIGR